MSGSDVQLAPFIHRMIENRWFGDKAQQGFYKKAGKDAEGRDLRHVLDWQTLDYKPATRPKFPALEMAKNVEATGGAGGAAAACRSGEGQGGGVLLAAADGAVYLCGEPGAGDCCIDRRDR